MKKAQLVALVFKGADYINNGIPLKDAMDRDEVDLAICLLAELLEAEGWERPEDDEETTRVKIIKDVCYSSVGGDADKLFKVGCTGTIVKSDLRGADILMDGYADYVAQKGCDKKDAILYFLKNEFEIVDYDFSDLKMEGI